MLNSQRVGNGKPKSGMLLLQFSELLNTDKSQDGQIGLTYFGYAIVPFVLTFVVGYYRSKFSRQSQRLAT